MRTLYDALIEVDEKGVLAPQRSVAERWEESPEKLTITFFIRKGIKFHNGDELTAEDVKFTIERALAPKSVAVYKVPMAEALKSIEVVDPYKVVAHLKYYSPTYIDFFSSNVGMEAYIVPKKYIEAKGDEYFQNNPVGSGPYKWVGQVIGSYMRYAALDSHWRAGVPRFMYITYIKVPEEGTRVAMLKRGEADIVEMSKERIGEVKKAGFEVRMQEGAYNVGMYLYKLWEADNPLQDLRVRKALSLAINRKEIVDFVFAGGAKSVGNFPYPSWSLGYSPREPYPYDPAQAKKLLAEAGYGPGGKTLKMSFYAFLRVGLPEVKTLAETVAGYWREIGVTTEITPMDWAAFRRQQLEDWRPVAYPSAGFHAIGNRSNYQAGMFVDMSKTSNFYLVGRFSSEVQEGLESWLKSGTIEEFKSRNNKLTSVVYDNHLTIPIAEVDLAYGVNPQKVGEWNMGRVPYDFNLEYLFRQK